MKQSDSFLTQLENKLSTVNPNDTNSDGGKIKQALNKI